VARGGDQIKVRQSASGVRSMTVSMHRASVPVFTQMLGSLSAVLEKGETFAAARNLDATAVLATRLFPDMMPLSRQAQIATDHAKGACARLGQVDVPKFEDVEASFADLRERIGKTLAFIEGVDAAAFAGSEDRQVTLTLGGREITMKGDRYLFHFALPNFFFHVTTAYDILRHLGVALGKRDFVGVT
jgi:hypothetical protein